MKIKAIATVKNVAHSSKPRWISYMKKQDVDVNEDNNQETSIKFFMMRTMKVLHMKLISVIPLEYIKQWRWRRRHFSIWELVLFRGNTSRLQNVLRNILLFNKWFDDLIWFFLDVPGRPVMWINSIKLWTSTNVHYCISTDQILDVLGRAQAVQWTSLDTRFQLDR